MSLLLLASLVCYHVLVPTKYKIKVILLLSLLFAGFFGTTLLAGSLFHKDILVRNTVSERQVVGLKKEIAAIHPDTRHVLLINGASYTHRALNGAELEELFAKAGYSVEVLTVSLPGANHFERSMMLNQIMPLLRDISNTRPKTKFIYFNELHSGYDLNPLAQIRQTSDRMISYATLPVAWNITKAAMRFWPDAFSEPERRKALRTLWQSAILRALGYGQMRTAVVTSAASNFPPYRPMNNRAAVPQNAFDRAIDFLEDGSPERIDIERAKLDLPLSTEHRQWLELDVDPALDAKIDTLFTEQRYFLPFTTNIRDYVYFSHQCGFADIRCLDIEQDYISAFSSLLTQEFWIDPNHVSKSGSAVFTDWFAQQVLDEDLLIK
jgi:hypothetical protein